MAENLWTGWGGFPDGRTYGSESFGNELWEAARQVWPQVVAIARRKLASRFTYEEREIMTIESWEDTLLSVSGTLNRHQESSTVQDLKAFLVGTFEHRLARTVLKEKALSRVIEFRPYGEEFDAIASGSMEDWVTAIEDEILVRELLRRMDEWTRKVFVELRFGFTWKEIAKHMGTTQQQVKMRFHRNIDKLRKEINDENRGRGDTKS